MFAHIRPASLAFVLFASLQACADDEHRAYARATEPRGTTIVEPVAAPYTPANVTLAGTLSGTVHFAGAAPVDTVVTISRDERVCGNTLRHMTVQTTEDRVIGAVVWISDIRSGRPLPLSRRHELVQTRCTYGPLVQVALAGGTLNVRTHDPLAVRSVVIDTRTLDTVAFLPFNSAGALIPLHAQLRQPAMLEVRSTTHPWMQAWVAVLDHPYHATTDAQGGFAIEGVPPGQYQVRAWHPRFGLASGGAQVEAGRATQISLTFDRADDAIGARQAAAPVAAPAAAAPAQAQ